MFEVLNVDGFLTVEQDDQMRTLRGNLVGIPLAAGLGHRVHLGDTDDCAGAIGRVRPLVEDIDLVADLGVGLLRAAAAEEDAAVGIVVGPEFGLDLEILVGGLADEKRGLLALGDLVGAQRTVLHRPVGFADLDPLSHPRAIYKRDPAVGLSQGRAGKLNGIGADQQAGCKCRQVLQDSPPGLS